MTTKKTAKTAETAEAAETAEQPAAEAAEQPAGGAAEEAPAEEPAAGGPQWGEVQVSIGKNPGLNIRVSDKPNGTVIGSLPNGLILPAVPAGDGWMKLKGAECYVMTQFVQPA